MGMSSAQRQAQYRAKRPFAGADGNGERRISCWVNTSAQLALARLARREKTSMRAVLERLLAAEDERVLAGLRGDEAAWDAYFGGVSE